MGPEYVEGRIIGTLVEFDGELFLEEELEGGLFVSTPVKQIGFDEANRTYYTTTLELVENISYEGLHLVKEPIDPNDPDDPGPLGAA